MATIKRTVTAASANLLEGLRFSKPEGFAAINVWASAAAAGEALNIGGGTDQVVAESLAVNLESGDRVVDAQRDQIVFNEILQPGQVRLELPTLAGADLTYMIHIATG